MTEEEYIQELKKHIEMLKEMIENKDRQIDWLRSFINGNPPEPEKPNWKIYK